MPRGIDRYDEARIQSRLWTPQLAFDVVGLWLDSSDTSTLVNAGGSTISRWIDKRWLTKDFRETSSSSFPTINYTSVPPLSTVVFDGNDRLDEPNGYSGTELPLGTAPSSMFFAWNIPSVASSQKLFHYGTANTGLCRNIGVKFQLLEYGTYGDSNFSSDNPVGKNLASWRVTPPNSIFNYNGGANETRTFSGVTFATNGLNSGGAIGDMLTFEPISAGGSLLELVICSGSLGDSRRAVFEGYLAWKWNLVGNLPASHSFKNRPPLIGD